ncbi:MAG: 30S ribosomal protein S13 [Candidatus Pacearchaeota archaeon]
MAEENRQQRVVRILQKDIDGELTTLAGLTKANGISWSVANATCFKLGIDKKQKLGELSDDQIQKVESFFQKPEIPEFLKNRRKDLEDGQDKHLTGSDLNLRKEFDIKRMKKIKSYKGSRHIAKLPARGQMTKANFRKNKAKGVGIKKKGK